MEIETFEMAKTAEKVIRRLARQELGEMEAGAEKTVREIAREEAQKVLAEVTPPATVELAYEPIGKVRFGQQDFIVVETMLDWLDAEMERLNAARYDEKTPERRGDWLWGQVTALHAAKDFLNNA